MRGVSRFLAMLRSEKVLESQLNPDSPSLPPGSRSRVFVFQGMEGMFNPLLPHRQFVRSRLLSILAPALKQGLEQDKEEYGIVAHVRRGDKPELPMGKPFPNCPGSDGLGMPTQWFKNCIENIRAVVGPVPATIFSDGTDEQLRDLLSLPHTRRAKANPSLLDILLLARGKVLITTGTSTFSMWANFLGEMPSIWYPGLKMDLTPDKPGYATDTDLDGRLPSAFADILKAAGSRQ